MAPVKAAADFQSASDTRVVSWRLLGTALWGVGVALVFLVVQIAATAVYLFNDRANLDEEDVEHLIESVQTDGLGLAVATIASALICVPLILGIVKLKRSSRITEYLALKPVSFRVLGRWLAILVAFLAAYEAMSVLVGRPLVPDFMRLSYESADPVWPLWLALILAGPVFEETFFRGFLHTGLATSFLGASGAVIVTSLAWTVVHFQYGAYELGAIFLLGILLGLSRIRSGSLLVPLALHSVANFGAVLETALLT